MTSTKIVPPQLNDVCERPRLIELLDQASNRAVTWLAAPAGSGKTCLLGSYLRGAGPRTVWLHLDEGDADLASFFFYLKAAVRAVVGARADRLPVFAPEYQQGRNAFARSYFEQLFALLGPDKGIVLDGYEAVGESSELNEVLAIAAAQTPTRVRWYVASRSRPPLAFARLRLDRLKEFTWDDLRLTAEETRRLSESRTPRQRLPDAALERLQAATQGWAAGVVLLIESGRLDVPTREGVASEDSKPMFDYFAAEVLDRLPELHQQVLIKSALLPQVDGEAARRLTGVPSAPQILEDTAERNYFAYRYPNRASLFRLHPLFRSFLLRRAEELLTPEQRRQLSAHAAELLERDGQLESAAELLRDAHQWAALARLAIRHAETLIGHGRHQLLTQWITSIPEGAARDADPWLWHWLATSRLPFHPDVARADYERAFELFVAQPEPSNAELEGVFLSWAGVIEATLFSWQSLAGLDHWIDRLEKLLLRHKPPSLRVDARVAALMHGALIFRRPESDAVIFWEKRVRRFLFAARFIDVNHYVLLANNLFHHDLWTGRLSRAMELLGSLDRAASSPKLGPMAKGGWYTMRAVSSLFTGDYAQGRQAVDDGVAYSRQSGVLFWEPILLSQGAFTSLGMGELDRAAGYLEQMRAASSADQPNVGELYHDASAQLDLARGRLVEAEEHARIAVEQAVRFGATFSEAGARLGYGHTLYALGECTRGREQLGISLSLARAMKSACIEARALLGLAYMDFSEGKPRTGDQLLARGLELAAGHGMGTQLWWIPEVITVACERALEAGIETDYVRTLIWRRGVLPSSERMLDRGWPVPLRVECLGALRISLHDKPLTFSRKAQLRPLELLLAVIAMGGERVSEGALAGALWPDSDGDAAAQALATTLHRLRKLVGNDVVVRREQSLSLNRTLCWVDALACQRTWTTLEQLELDELLWSVRRYRGAFLPETHAPWAVVCRERMSARFVRAARECGRRLADAGRRALAIELLEHCVDVEPTAEALHRELIRALRDDGRNAEAAAAYERCRRTLRATFDVEPSTETTDLLRGRYRSSVGS